MFRCILVAWFFLSGLTAQRPSTQLTTIHAAAKGPSQVNLSWTAPRTAGIEYQVEVQSDADPRYSNRTLLKPIKPATGFSCDPSIQIKDVACQVSDSNGSYLVPAPVSVPYWVTEPQYSDPVDDTPAQYIVAGLRPETAYTFWVTGRTPAARDPEIAFNSVSVTTAGSARRYVDPSGNDDAEGDSPDRAWKTLAKGTSQLQCGQVLIVSGGTYEDDSIRLNQSCSAENRAVVLARDAEPVILRSRQPNSVTIGGQFLVLDGIEIASRQNQDYDLVVTGHHNALLNLDLHPAAIPTTGSGLYLTGNHNLIYGSYLHDYGSPDDRQNPGGNGGFVLTLQGSGAKENVVWSNHFTRGGHDVSLCKDSCSKNRWLNNIMDGGWGMGWEAVGNADENLFEGNIIGHTGKLVTFYKPGIEVSGNRNTVRRNVIADFSRVAIEVSAFLGTAAGNRIYNNTIVGQGNCLFMSANGGDGAYEGTLFANNLCFKATSPATEIYPGNTSCSIANNAFVNVGSNGKLQRGGSVIIWNHSAAGDFQYPRPVSFADQTYPPFTGNASLEVLPELVSESQWNFRLKPASKLIGVGVPVDDPIWGSVARPADIGAYGIPSTNVATDTNSNYKSKAK